MYRPLSGISLLLTLHLAHILPAEVVNQTDVERDLDRSSVDIGGELCQRECFAAGQPRICYFKFVLEHYQAMGVACGNCARGVDTDCDAAQCIVGDGIEKGVMSINRQVPGPAIHVCKNDLIVVDIENSAHGTAAAMHWHGLHMTETPYMDGVPFVTQCPIAFGNTFRYQFNASEAGTQFYHSHAGHHKVNGQYGALIIREPLVDVLNKGDYDYDLPEHYILISDWMHSYAEELSPGLPSSAGIIPDSLLINGRGAYIQPTSFKRQSVPPHRYYVKSQEWYRFRIINSVSHSCPVQLQIEGHNFRVIATDGEEVMPSIFNTLFFNSGERYDIVLKANYTQGDFWIRARGMGLCASPPMEAIALLRYRTNNASLESDETRSLPPLPDYSNELPLGQVLNHPDAICFNGDNLHCVSELRSYNQDLSLQLQSPDQQLFLSFNNHLVPNAELFQPGKYSHFLNLYRNVTLVGAINNLSLTFPDYPPLTQPELIKDSDFCDNANKPASCANKELCNCVHLLRLRLNSIVELVMIDERRDSLPVSHPFHLHGHLFTVNAMGRAPLGERMTLHKAREMELSDVTSETYRPPLKDTVSIPNRGYAVVRFRANNPGFWLMHCHYEWHLAAGMGLVMQVGDVADMKSPPIDFPRCGNYMPNIRLGLS